MIFQKCNVISWNIYNYFSFSIAKKLFFNSTYKNQIDNWNDNKLNWNNDFEIYEIFESETRNIVLLNKTIQSVTKHQNIRIKSLLRIMREKIFQIKY